MKPNAALALAAMAALTWMTASGQSAATAHSGNAPVPGQKAAARHSIYQPERFAGRADTYYSMVWGIDSVSVKLVESGELVRFSYRVLDPAKARMLNDKKSQTSLLDPRAGVSLTIPTVENIGQLRQTDEPVAGRAYWMTFSNKGRPVKRGDRVSVLIGQFRAENLVVD